MICTIKMHLNYGLNILIIKTKLVLSSSNFNRFIKINTLWLFVYLLHRVGSSGIGR